MKHGLLALSTGLLLWSAPYSFAMCSQAVTDEGKTALETLADRSPVVIETDLLQLQTPQPRDLPQLLPLFQDFATVQYTWFAFAPGETRWTLETLRERFDWQAGEELKGLRHDWIIRLRAEPHTVIGRCALYRAEALGEWEFGITIGRDYWRRGYGEQTTRAVLDYAFSQLRARDVVLEVLPENAAMQATCKKLGLRQVRSAREAAPSGPFSLKYDYFLAERPRD